jgi:hypothetical protein
MPPPKPYSSPQFSPYGRYMINLIERKVARENNQPTTFHDSENLKDECNIQEVEANYLSRFNNPDWAKQADYKPCSHCQ